MPILQKGRKLIKLPYTRKGYRMAKRMMKRGYRQAKVYKRGTIASLMEDYYHQGMDVRPMSKQARYKRY